MNIMRIRTTTRRSALALLLTLATGFAALFTFALARPARADRTEPRRAANALSPVGIADGQTLRVTFLNVGSNPFEIIPCLFDGDGLHLKQGEPLTLAPGQMRSFDLSRSEAGERTERRVQVRAGVHADNPDLKNLVVSGEVIEEETGKSSLYVPPGLARVSSSK